MRIACLVACYNRRDTTVRALRAPCSRRWCPASTCSSTSSLTDDGSTDGTADAVARMWPGAIIRHGDGSLFWAVHGPGRTVRRRHRPDYYLWLNDDTLLDPGALATLLRVSADHPQAIVHPDPRPRDRGVHLRRAQPTGDHPIRHGELHATTEANVHHGFDTFEGNRADPGRAVHDAVGLIDDEFPHRLLPTPTTRCGRAPASCRCRRPVRSPPAPANPPRTPADSWDAAWQTLQSPKGYPWQPRSVSCSATATGGGLPGWSPDRPRHLRGYAPAAVGSR